MPKNILSILFIFLFLLNSLAYAQEEFSNELTLKTRTIAASDVDAQSAGRLPSGGNIGITESELNFKHGWKAFGEMPLEFSLDYLHTDIDDELPELLPTRLEARRLGLDAKFPLPFTADEHYFMGVTVFAKLNTDDWQWKASAYRMPFRTYLIYKQGEDFILVGGLNIRPGYDTVVLPVLGLIYKPNDKLSFNLASEDPNITYKLTDKTTALWEFDFQFEEYEVTRDGQDGIVLKYNDLSTGVGLEHQFTKNLAAAFTVGSVFGRRLEYKNEDYGKVVPDAGVYVQARVTADF